MKSVFASAAVTVIVSVATTSDFLSVNKATAPKVGQRKSGEITPQTRGVLRLCPHIPATTYPILYKLLLFLITRSFLFCLNTYLSDTTMSINAETAKR